MSKCAGLFECILFQMTVVSLFQRTFPVIMYFYFLTGASIAETL